MSTLKDWTCKGFDLTFDGSRGWDEKKQNETLYPYLEVKGFEYMAVDVKRANSIECMRSRIGLISNAITKASKV